jgi:hypothetical protein
LRPAWPTPTLTAAPAAEVSLLQNDYLMKMIHQVTEALARAFKSIKAKELAQAEQGLGEGYAVLGMDAEMLSVLDGATLRNQLRDEEKLVMACRLLACEAELRIRQGDGSLARQRLKAARKLRAQLADVSGEAASLDEALQRAAAALEHG